MFASCEDFDEVGVKKTAKPIGEINLVLKIQILCKSIQLVLLSFGRCLKKLAVTAPLLFSLLAKPQNFGAQLIPFNKDSL